MTSDSDIDALLKNKAQAAARKNCSTCQNADAAALIVKLLERNKAGGWNLPDTQICEIVKDQVKTYTLSTTSFRRHLKECLKSGD